MPQAEAFEIITAVADALDYAHLRGLLHRDVKPANILLTEAAPQARRILLADFGIARELGDISGLTVTNMVVGTTAYSAPEQLMGSDIDGRADQYALGCTAFHLLTGCAPYQNSNPAVVITQHLSATPPPIGERRPELARLTAVVAKVLAKDPQDRYPSCSDFATALTGHPSIGAAATVAANAAVAPTMRFAAPAEPLAAKPGRRRLRPATLISVIATVVLVAVAVVVGALLLHRHANKPNDAIASTGSNPPGSSATAAAPALQLTRYITDSSGALTAPGRAAVEQAISKLYNQRNVHLWVVYVNDFAGLTPFRWAEDTMRANGFTDTDGLLAISTANRTFAFRVPRAMTDGTAGTRVNGELIRRNRIAPAVRESEWARAAVAAANGLETAGS
jgi:serine/threonine-protein kinase